MTTAWSERVRQAMVAADTVANREAVKLEARGDQAGADRLRVYGRLNGIQDALIVLSEQLEKGH